MRWSSAKPTGGCSTFGAFALLGGVVVLDLASNGLSVLQSLSALGFGAGALVLAAMMEWTVRRAATAGPMSRGQRVWNAAVFVVWVMVMAVLLWWHMARSGVPAAAP